MERTQAPAAGGTSLTAQEPPVASLVRPAAPDRRRRTLAPVLMPRDDAGLSPES